MVPKRRRLGLVLVLALLTGCDSNPEGPRAPAAALSKAAADGQAAPEKAARRPITKSRREIVNPE